ncbi:MAG: TIGR00730 family Rossman fold protein [Candidatus Gastranaerophilales bacterium]|nr:TIGR00730 family Rossman fold protein [Candidatus Gastranaerophilales bacterium]
MTKNICVYCSSSDYLDNKFYETAYLLGKKIAENGYNLIYGGSTFGIMGKVADGVINNGGSVTGIIPKAIMAKGVSNPKNSNVIITNDMNDRKQIMEEKADIFLALPGSFGTLDEIMQVIVTKQLSYHKKAIIFLDIDNYYKPLFEMFENFYKYGFAKDFNRELYYITDSLEDVFDYCSKYVEKEFVFKY